eukprot:GFYU01016076.1.p1 GENE.GFYU01016076.1~~GFYU01016076.1.p1  ORF type:complete len:626 (+),score=149.36 GFYU01016076.1:94-1971(+)
MCDILQYGHYRSHLGASDISGLYAKEWKRKSVFTKLYAREYSDRYRQQRAIQHGIAVSRSVVSRLSLTRKLVGHEGCVNTVKFDQGGKYIITGSDDHDVRIWSANDYSSYKVLPTGHNGNVFGAQFVPDGTYDRIVSTAADGQIRLNHVNAGSGSGSTLVSELIDSWHQMTLDVCFAPFDPNLVVVSAADGNWRWYDLRVHCNNRATRGPEHQYHLLMEPGSMPEPVDMFSSDSTSVCAFDPHRPHIFVGGSRETGVLLQDFRYHGQNLIGPNSDSTYKPTVNVIRTYKLPGQLTMQSRALPSLTGLAFGEKGEIAVNYLGNDVYTFDTRRVKRDSNVCTEFIHRFRGRENAATFLKDVCFMSDGGYVCTGADCGNLFVWDSETADLVLKIKCDAAVLNSVASHPFLPVLAVSGIDDEAKILEVGEMINEGDAKDASRLKRNRERQDGGRIIDRHRQAPQVLTAEECADRQKRAMAFKEDGNAAFKAKTIPQALSFYERMIDALRYSSPSDDLEYEREQLMATAMLNKAACYTHQKEFTEVIALCTEVLEFAPQNVKALYRRATAYLHAKCVDEAKDDIDKLEECGAPESDVARIKKQYQTVLDHIERQQARVFARMFGGGGDEK